VADYRGAEVYTLEGRRVGRIKEINSRYFTAFKRGLVMDKEFRIPISSISAAEKHDNATIVRLSLKEEKLKHGYEFAKGRPNSEFASGATEREPKIPLEMPVIHYESYQAEACVAADRLPAISEYLCDMCDEKFAYAAELQEHRTSQHRGPTDI
jgi:hypothetical protein